MSGIFQKTKVWLREVSRKIAVLVGALGPFGRVVFYVLSFLAAISLVAILYLINEHLQIEVPARGGSYSEGIVGTPRFINPVLALSDADRDLSSLVYSGLLKTSPDGTFVPDLAQRIDVSEDGTTYTVTLLPNAQFQDSYPVTADDVAFTVAKAQDPALKSPQRANWDGVTVAVIDSKTVTFTLTKPYAPFIENLTLGILPKHLWQQVSASEFPFSTLNTKPIGSGPYQVDTETHTASGVPSTYELSAFENYAMGAPYISTISLHFYQSEDALVSALRRGDVMAGGGISPIDLTQLKGLHVIAVPLNRVFGVFFNQNQDAVLRDPAVRSALNTAIDRQDMITKVLSGYATPLSGPIPSTIYRDTTTTNTLTGTAALAAARAQLAKAGWVPGEHGILQKMSGTGKQTRTQQLTFTISTSNVPELAAAADYLKQTWEELGAQVTVAVYEQGDLSENAIRPRKYDALLFGEIVGHGLDLFAFWHSSQRNDPGLNISLYANPNVDTLLEKLRLANSDSDRAKLYDKIEQQINADVPAVFLYAPEYLYVMPEDLHGASFSIIKDPSDRFDSIEHWYLHTDRVWPIFARGS